MSAQHHPFAVTFFDHVSARFKREQIVTLDQLHEIIINTHAEWKDLLPLLKLARFGQLTTDKACLRHDRNVLAVTGCELDYDAGSMSFMEAADRLRHAKVHALVYTSPSHTIASPRWRVLCPFAREIAPEQRRQMVARLNGILGGVAAIESFSLSQSFYYGYLANPDGSPLNEGGFCGIF